jgi:hypothetical protein
MNTSMVRTMKLSWLIPLGAAVGAPLALLAARFDDGTILAFAAAANALALVP